MKERTWAELLERQAAHNRQIADELEARIADLRTDARVLDAQAARLHDQCEGELEAV